VLTHIADLQSATKTRNLS